MSFILASASSSRSKILSDAGLTFTAQAADIDERQVEAPLVDSGATPADIAEVLAIAKASHVSERYPGKTVLGADQTLSLGDDVLHKSPDMDDARRKLLRLQGKTHQLNSAWCLVRDGRVLVSQVAVADMTMRTLSPQFIGRYLAACGDEVLSSVGCYQIEGRGVQLFEDWKGDHFTIIGLPLLAILPELRKLDVID